MHFTVYSKDNCPYCISAIKLLTDQKLDFTVKKIGVDVERDWILATFPTMRTVPVIVLDESILIGGFDQLKEYLNG